MADQSKVEGRGEIWLLTIYTQIFSQQIILNIISPDLSCACKLFPIRSAFLLLQWNSSGCISTEWLHSIVKVKHATPVCTVRCVTRLWPLALCTRTVNRPAGFLLRRSSDESLLSWCLTTGVSTSKTRRHTHAHTYSHVRAQAQMVKVYESARPHIKHEEPLNDA